MDNLKTITPREIKQIASTFYEQPKYIMWHGKRIKINPLLSFEESVNLIYSILESCLGNKSVMVESVEFIFWVMIVEKYTGIKLPDDLECKYKIIYDSDLVDTVKSNINQKQLKSIAKIIMIHTGIDVL